MKIDNQIKAYKTWGAWILVGNLKSLAVRLPGLGEFTVELEQLSTKRDQEELIDFIAAQNYYNSEYDKDLERALNELTKAGLIKLNKDKRIN